MPELSWPFEGQDTTESQFSSWARALVDTGIVSGLTLTPGSGLAVVVAPGAAFLQGFYFQLTAPAKSITITAAPGTGLTRRDFIILRLDLIANEIVVVVKNGSATNSGGTLPALVQDATVWELAIGVVTVANATISISAANISELRPAVGLRVLPFAGVTQRPTPVTRTIGVDTVARVLQLFDAGVWYELTPSITWATITGKPTTFPPSVHTHAWLEITSRPSTFPPDAHVHDDRYFTEAETTSLLADKSNTGHGHSWTEITSKPTTFEPSAHSHDWNSITSKPSTFAPSSHGHSWGQISGIPGSFNPSAHNHDAGNITSGTLTVRIGGSQPIGSSHNWNYSVANVTRRAVWMDSNGVLGHTASSGRYKKNVTPAVLSVEAIRQIELVNFEYKKGDGGIETGVIAEQIESLGLEFLVDRNVDNTIEGVHYTQFGLAALALAQSLADRVDALEAKLAEKS